MSIEFIDVSKLRNIEAAQLHPSPDINLISGLNGSGKTSLLEAIHLLASARSFRSSKMKPMIAHGENECMVFARIKLAEQTLPVGVQRDRQGGALIKVSGKLVNSASVLAELIPLQLITPDSFRLLEGSPKVRRQFIDWGVFHVEHRFLNLWKQLQNTLKQRNSLLRSVKIDASLLAVWDQQLVALVVEIDDLRQQYCAQFVIIFREILEKLLPGFSEITLGYYRGWDASTDFAVALSASLERDKRAKFTHLGPQRADLRVRLNGHSAVELLSRGQQKLLVCALKIAQGLHFQQATGKRCIYLLDDLAAELDSAHRQTLCDLLQDMKSQVFITGVDRSSLECEWREDIELKMFHVEHGRVSEVA